MLVRIEVFYPHQTVVGEQFPPSPSTLFQAIVAANGHRLDEISDVLQSMESGKCVRIIQHSETAPISLRTAVPRMPKAGEANNFKFDDPANKLLEPQKVFPLDGNGVHLSYYFELVPVARERLSDALRGFTSLGGGKAPACLAFRCSTGCPTPTVALNGSPRRLVGSSYMSPTRLSSKSSAIPRRQEVEP